MACTMPATGVRPPFRMLVAVRAIAPVAGMPPKIGDAMLAMPEPPAPCWTVPAADHAVGYMAESIDSMAPSKAMVERRARASGPVPRQCGSDGQGARPDGAIESMLSAMVADGMIGSRHRSNMELVAQGIANIASPSSAAFRHGSDRPHRDQHPNGAARRSPASYTPSPCSSSSCSSASMPD